MVVVTRQQKEINKKRKDALKVKKIKQITAMKKKQTRQILSYMPDHNFEHFWEQNKPLSSSYGLEEDSSVEEFDVKSKEVKNLLR